MPPALLLALMALLAQPVPTDAQTFEQRTFKAPDGSMMRYGLSVPAGYTPSRPRPLVLALHPGGGGSPYYGAGFMRSIFLPGLRDLAPIMIAPDVPGRTWTEPRAEQAVVALVAAARQEFAIDPRRIAVVGFSLGGAGTWHLSSRHADLFTAAIVMAGRTDAPLASLGKIPTYVIHGGSDEVVPFAQAEERARGLEKAGRPVRFDALPGVSHYEMGSYVDALARGGRWVSERWTQ